MQSAPFFTPDNTNRGGLKQIQTHYLNHRVAVKTAKPMINSLVAPHPHVNDLRNSGSFSSRFKSPLGSPTMRKTTHLNRSMSKYVMNEHDREWQLLKNKVRNSGTNLVQKKKDPNNPFVRPVVLFRDLRKIKTQPLDSHDMSHIRPKKYKFITKMLPMGPLDSKAKQVDYASECMDGMTVYEADTRKDINRIIKKWQPVSDSDLYDLEDDSNELLV